MHSGGFNGNLVLMTAIHVYIGILGFHMTS